MIIIIIIMSWVLLLSDGGDWLRHCWAVEDVHMFPSSSVYVVFLLLRGLVLDGLLGWAELNSLALSSLLLVELLLSSSGAVLSGAGGCSVFSDAQWRRISLGLIVLWGREVKKE